MNLFEYITVAISIVLSMSIVRSLESLGDVMDPKRRDGIHMTWFLVRSFHPAIMWWSIWGLHDQEEWNFLAFLMCLLGPVFLFLQVTTLTTREPDEVKDWGSHFMAVRKRFFAASLGAAFSGPALVAALGDFDAALLLLGGVALESSIALVGIISDKRSVHIALATAAVLIVSLWTTLLFRPIVAG